MFKITEDKKILLTKGDTAYLTIELSNEDVFSVGDIVIFSLKRKLKDDAEYALQKEITVTEEANTLQIKIEPTDTEQLSYGNYYYDVQLTRKSSGDIFTIITPDENEPITNFRLLKEVTV